MPSSSGLGRVLGGFGALLVTPVFALSYFPAHGSATEQPPPWLAGVRSTFVDLDLLGAEDAVGLYNGYGRIFGVTLLLVLFGMLMLLRDRPQAGDWSVRGWITVMSGAVMATAGVFSDYADVDALSSFGFAFELLGFLIVAVGTVILGWSLWREEQRARLAVVVALVGPFSLLGGTAVTAHIPSGPALILMVAAVAIAVFGLWSERTLSPSGWRE